ncbi:BlaI/MecI/CopY family transcriptional regulator [Paraclostridium bifermentans]|jgi:BlaI family penicillinase repressor|uniref:BlaI/MecI/CopY family transcriptional regulator n=1 Tax=Paraclostridium bifermentans TaxID=1490 RepID=UPI000DF7C38C|nr:BlaI/MecI/CopY family transcriptional regulator [Paraclostridium bifermentans]RDC48867.1 BlaI/MecI/CopY family transcriptional regulator [Acinetobacter sp. RIT592]
MKLIKISDSEMKFMNLVWDNSPINSTKLVKLAEEHLGWKKSTTYTVIRRLSQRGILKNENAVVSFIVNKEEVQETKGQELIGKVYEGSIKMFLSAFLNKEKISKEEAEELKSMIDEYIYSEE